MSERTWRITLVLIGGAHVGLAAWAAVSPESFVRTIANFGLQNIHLVHDFAACAATFGLGMLIAARVPAWRQAALTLAAVWTGLHAVSHILDAGDARPTFVGPIEAVALLLLTGVLAALAYGSASQGVNVQGTQPHRKDSDARHRSS